MKNFRDLGGNKTEDGRTVKKGLFYRSAKLSNLSENDIKILKELNIKYIFDYRSDEEARKHPSTIISNIKNIRIPAMRELEESQKAIDVLGLEYIEKIDVELPEVDLNHNILVFKKVMETPVKYPRKAGKPAKNPIK